MYHQALDNENIPLCFDTNAIFGEKTAKSFLTSVREHFPNRRLLIPTWVVAERSRQLKLERGNKFDLSKIRGFLDDPEIKSELVGFDREIVMRLEGNKLQSEWLKVVGKFCPDDWHQERCRVGDHIIYSTALRHSALLVTEDKQLLDQVHKDGAYPGAIRASELKAFIGYVHTK